MAENSEKVASLMGTRRLADAVRAAKIAAAQRSDVVIDIREADRARLEILAEELRPIAEELDGYHYFHLARADMLAATGERGAARAAFDRALALCENETERRTIARVAAERTP